MASQRAVRPALQTEQDAGYIAAAINRRASESRFSVLMSGLDPVMIAAGAK
jgi:hypothetical protein